LCVRHHLFPVLEIKQRDGVSYRMDSKSHDNPSHFSVRKDQTHKTQNTENPIVNVNLELVGLREWAQHCLGLKHTIRHDSHEQEESRINQAPVIKHFKFLILRLVPHRFLALTDPLLNNQLHWACPVEVPVIRWVF
jgi:hypothetical protein